MHVTTNNMEKQRPITAAFTMTLCSILTLLNAHVPQIS